MPAAVDANTSQESVKKILFDPEKARALADAEETENRKFDGKSFKDSLIEAATTDRKAIIDGLIRAAKSGDGVVLNQFLKRILDAEMAREAEENFRLTDEQFKQVILAVASRLQREVGIRSQDQSSL